jgi:hypothetical protein
MKKMAVEAPNSTAGRPIEMFDGAMLMDAFSFSRIAQLRALFGRHQHAQARAHLQRLRAGVTPC